MPSATALKPLQRKRFATRLGMTLIETTIVMIVAAAAMGAGASMYSDYLGNLTNKTTSKQLTEVSHAFSRYMDDNHQQLRTQVIANGGRLQVPFDNLKPDYLPNEFQNKTPYNHQYALVVRRASATSQELQGLVFTQYSDSRFALAPKDALEISRLAGAGGGYTGKADPQTVVSTYGNYNVDLATYGVNPGHGVLVSVLSVNQAGNPGQKYLHRNATGDPEHNRMNVSIDMNGNDMVDARMINAANVNATQIEASTIKATSLNSQNTSAGVLTASQATINGSVTANTASIDGRVTASNFKTQGAFIDPAHNEVVAASVRTNNWFRSYGDSGWYNETYGGGWYMSDGNWIRAYSGKSIYTSGEVQATRLTANEFVQINGWANAGWGCSSNGLVGRTSEGKLLSCVNGLWKAASGGGERIEEFARCSGQNAWDSNTYTSGTLITTGYLGCQTTKVCVAGAWLVTQPASNCGSSGGDN